MEDCSRGMVEDGSGVVLGAYLCSLSMLLEDAPFPRLRCFPG